MSIPDECPICLETPNLRVQFSCGHSICEGCFYICLGYLKGKKPFECPLCRMVIVKMENPVIEIDEVHTNACGIIKKHCPMFLFGIASTCFIIYTAFVFSS